jgi:hypothetical protein
MACHIFVALSIYPSTVPLLQQSADPFPLHCTDRGQKETRAGQAKGGRGSQPLPPSIPVKPFGYLFGCGV